DGLRAERTAQELGDVVPVIGQLQRLAYALLAGEPWSGEDVVETMRGVAHAHGDVGHETADRIAHEGEIARAAQAEQPVYAVGRMPLDELEGFGPADVRGGVGQDLAVVAVQAENLVRRVVGRDQRTQRAACRLGNMDKD